MKKNGHYRRVVWLSDQERELVDIVVDCLGRVAPGTLHVFDHTPEEQCLLAFSTSDATSAFVHFVTYEKGAGAAVIPIVRAATSTADEEPPPAGREYIQSQVFCRLQGNHAVWTTHNGQLRDASIYTIFANFIASLADDDAAIAFQFRAIIDREAYSRAFERGIEEIDLGLGDFRATLEALANGGELPNPGFMSDLVALVSQRPTRAEIDAAANVESRLTLRPGRDWEKPEVVGLLSKVAENVVTGYGDEFTIVTKDGFRLTRDKMSVQKEFNVRGNRRILDVREVADGLSSVFQRLEHAGVIDE